MTMIKSITGDFYLGFSEDGYCEKCGTHYENINEISGCENCIPRKFKEEDYE